MTIEVHQFPCLSDNYGYLVHDTETGETVCIDTPDAGLYMSEAARRGWMITQIWNTHWHPDHAGGNTEIKRLTNCKITAPAAESDKIEGIDHAVAGGDRFALGEHAVQVIDVGGHTNGHIAFHIPSAQIAFVGDSLFALGCGRMFEGTADQFWASLKRLKALPPETLIYCAHEYTQGNARFAVHADPENAAVRAYANEVDALRAKGKATVPTLMGRELATNPFLRADDPAMMARWDGSDPVSTFAALRAAKDSF